MGLRARVWKGLTLEGGVDVALRSAGFPYATPVPAYNVIFGASFPLDLDQIGRREVVVRTVEKTVELPAPVPAFVVGTVKDAKDGTPLAGAQVAVAGKPLSRVATDPDGRFRSVDVDAGTVVLEVTALGFEPVTTTVSVSKGAPLALDLALTRRPQIGNLHGRVTDAAGAGIEASIKLIGAENFEARSDSAGVFSAALPAGRYQVRAEAPGYVGQELPLEVVADQDRELVLAMAAPKPQETPVPASVVVGRDALKLKLAVRFRHRDSKLSRQAKSILDDIADVMHASPDIKKLRIEAHWDSGIPAAKAIELTRKQAQSIVAYLLEKKVPSERLEAAGVGSAKPAVPNIGPAKAKNRRIVFRIER